MNQSILKHKPARMAGYEFGIKKDQWVDSYKVCVITPLNYDQVVNNPRLDILISTIGTCPDVVVDMLFLPDLKDIRGNTLTNHTSHFHKKKLDDFNLIFVYAWSLFQVRDVLNLMIKSGFNRNTRDMPAIIAPLSIQTIATSEYFDQFIPLDSPALVAAVVNNVKKGVLNPKSPDFLDELSEMELNYEDQDPILPIQSLMKSWLEPSKEMLFMGDPFPSGSHDKIQWNLSEHIHFLDFDNLFLNSPVWNQLKMETWMVSSNFDVIQVEYPKIVLGENTKIWFLTELKKQPCPLQFRLKSMDEFRLIRGALKEYSEHGWRAFHVFLILEDPDSAMEHLNELLEKTDAEFNVRWTIKPDYLSVARHNGFSDEVISKFREWVNWGQTLRGENRLFFGSMEDLKFLLLLFQNKIDIGQESNANSITMPMFSLQKDGVINEKAAGLSSKLQKQFTAAHDSDKPVKVSVQNKKFGRSVRRRGVSTPPLKRRIRVKYVKLKPARYFSHADIMRIFRLTCRKAGVSVVYTGLKNPKPSISYSPSLPAGYVSLAEYADFTIEMKGSVRLSQALNPILPDGIKILEEVPVVKDVPSLASVISVHHYEISNGKWDVDRLESFMENDSCVVERLKGEQIIRLNIRPFVSELRVQDNILHCELRAVDGRMARIEEVLGVLSEEHPDRFFISRMGMFIEQNGQLIDPIKALSYPQ